MNEMKDTPTKNRPNYAFISQKEYKDKYYKETLDKFIEEYVTGDDETNKSPTSARSGGTESGPDVNNLQPLQEGDGRDKVRMHSRNILQYFFTLEDYRDAVSEGDGKRMAQIHKDFLLYFKTDPSFNAYSLEMMVNVAQNEILLSERESHRATWSQTVNWKGGAGKNIEADLMQENRNNDHKAAIKAMGPNKTHKAMHRATKAAGGQRKIVENFDEQTKVTPQSSSHTHRSSERDEEIIRQDLRRLRPFHFVPGRMHPSFPDGFTHPLEKVDFTELHAWLKAHMKKMAR